VPPAKYRKQQIDMALRVSLPVIVARRRADTSGVAVAGGTRPGGETQLTAVNPGLLTIR